MLEGFAFTMLVGIISGTYSSVFIAAAIVIIWQGRKPVKAAARPRRRRAGPGSLAGAVRRKRRARRRS